MNTRDDARRRSTPGGDSEVATTDGAIALRNLQAQIDGQEWRATLGRLSVGGRAELVERILLRGQVLGRIADSERAADLAAQLAAEAPEDGLAVLARARTRATFHRFPEALADLDLAAGLGADRSAVDAERATILEATGRDDEALVLRSEAVERQADFYTLGALAVHYAHRGKPAAAERLFAESRACYREVSPFPLALLDFQRGRMWLAQGDLPKARIWLEAACRRLPACAPAQAHLAEVEAARGEHEAALARLHPLTLSTDDPEYAARLAYILAKAGRSEEAGRFRRMAAARYDELAARYPEAFAEHAAKVRLTGTPRGIGGDLRPDGAPAES